MTFRFRAVVGLTLVTLPLCALSLPGCGRKEPSCARAARPIEDGERVLETVLFFLDSPREALGDPGFPLNDERFICTTGGGRPFDYNMFEFGEGCGVGQIYVSGVFQEFGIAWDRATGELIGASYADLEGNEGCMGVATYGVEPSCDAEQWYVCEIEPLASGSGGGSNSGGSPGVGGLGGWGGLGGSADPGGAGGWGGLGG